MLQVLEYWAPQCGEKGLAQPRGHVLISIRFISPQETPDEKGQTNPGRIEDTR